MTMSGMRANVSGHIMDRPFLDTIPFAHEMIPADLRAKAGALATPGMDDYLAFCKEAAARFHEPLRAPAIHGGAVGAAALHRTADAGRRRAGALDRFALPHPHPGDQDAGGDRSGIPRQDADPLHARSRPAACRHDDRPFDLGDRRGHRIDGRCRLLHRAQRHLQPEARRRHRAAAQAARRRRQRGAGIGRHLQQRHAAHVRRDACRGPAAFRQLARLRHLDRRLRSAGMRHDQGREERAARARDRFAGSRQEGRPGDPRPQHRAVHAAQRPAQPPRLLRERQLDRGGDGERRGGGQGRQAHARQRGRPAGRIARGVEPPICRCTPPSSAENAAFHPHFAAIHKRCTSMDVGINRYGSDMPAWKGHNRRVN